jgi:hypothetical protein
MDYGRQDEERPSELRVDFEALFSGYPSGLANRNRIVFGYRIECFGSNQVELYADRIECFFSVFDMIRFGEDFETKKSKILTVTSKRFTKK